MYMYMYMHRYVCMYVCMNVCVCVYCQLANFIIIYKDNFVIR